MNWGQERRGRKRNLTICIIVNTIFDKHSKDEKKKFKFDLNVKKSVKYVKRQKCKCGQK